MSSALTLLMLFHTALTFVLVGIFVALCALFGTASTVQKRVLKLSERRAGARSSFTAL